MRYPTVRLKDVLLAVADLGGLTYDRQLTPEQLASIVRMSREHLLAVQEEYQWPDLTDVEERHYRPAWNSAETYAAGDEVWRETDDGTETADVYYRATEASTDNDPAGDGVLTPSASVIDDPTGAITGTATTRDEDDTGPFTITLSNVPAGVTYRVILTGQGGGTAEAVTTRDGVQVDDNVVAGGNTFNVDDFINPGSITFTVSMLPATCCQMGAVTIIDVTASMVQAWEAVSGASAAQITNPTIAPLALYVELVDDTGSEIAGVPAAPMGKVFKVWDSDPDTNPRAGEIDFELRGGRIRLPIGMGLTSVWVEYQIPVAEIEPTPWDELETVNTGAVRYVDGALNDAAEIGDCYRALEVTTGEFPPLSDEWEIVPFPACLAPIVKYLASAETLRAGGKEDTAQAREGKAAEALQRALQSINMHQRQSSGWSVRSAGGPCR